VHLLPRSASGLPLPGVDSYWEAVDLWYGATNDQEWYDPSHITTKDGKLSILLEEVENHGLPCWNKFCCTSGYIEVSDAAWA
jgi:beta-glucanase (GH16 family)